MADDEKKPDAPKTAAEPGETPKSEPPLEGAAKATVSPEEELKAAFGHLKSAAGAFFDRIAKDDSLKKAAHDAEAAVARAATGAGEALKKLGDSAEPMAKTVAKEIGDELGRVARTVSSVFEPDPIPGDAKTEEAKAEAKKADGAVDPTPDATNEKKDEPKKD